MIDEETRLQQNFIEEKEYGYMPGVGIYVDDTHNTLYAIGGYYAIAGYPTSLFKFALDSGELIKRYDLTEEGRFLNDMVMDTKGNLFLTDTKGSAIYKLSREKDRLQLLYQSKAIQYPNGIAIAEDDSKLYIASFSEGIRALDLQSLQLMNQRDTTGVSQGIDGLEFYNGSLYAIQNGLPIKDHNFRKLELDESQREFLGVTVLDQDNPELNVPLTFCIAGSSAVVIGNSNLQYVDQSVTTMNITSKDSLQNTKLLVYDLIGHSP